MLPLILINDGVDVRLLKRKGLECGMGSGGEKGGTKKDCKDN